MVDNDGLNDWVISFSLWKGQLDFIIFQTLSNFRTCKIQSITLHFDFNILFMSSVLSARLFNDIEVLKHNFVANLDVENSLASVLEIHFSKFQNNGIDSLPNRQLIRHIAISMSFIHINIFIESEPKSMQELTWYHFLLRLYHCDSQHPQTGLWHIGRLGRTWNLTKSWLIRF